MKLLFKNTRIVQHNRYPGEEGVTQVLKVISLLTRTLAETLKCHDLCFAASGVPRNFEGFITLPERMGACEIVAGDQAFSATQAVCFKVTHPQKASDTDVSLEIHYNLHFTAEARIGDWMDEQNKAEFIITLKPPKDWRAQGELAFEDKTNPEEDGQEAIEETLTGDALEAHNARTGAVASAASMGRGRRAKREQIADPE